MFDMKRSCGFQHPTNEHRSQLKLFPSLLRGLLLGVQAAEHAILRQGAEQALLCLIEEIKDGP